MKNINFIISSFFVAILLNGSAAQAQLKADARDTMMEKSISCHCFGEIECWGFTGAIGGNYSWPCKKKHDADCCVRVRNLFNSLPQPQKQAIADCLCAKGKTNGYKLELKGSVGAEKTYFVCDDAPTLVNIPAEIKTTCTCPKGWLANQTNIDGGVTADGKCKKAVCSPISVPTPSGYTAVGEWGFIDGNTLYAWGTATNGGKAICVSVLIKPKVCKLQ